MTKEQIYTLIIVIEKIAKANCALHSVDALMLLQEAQADIATIATQLQADVSVN